ncbi:MAG: PucR family transcriptional regulator [Frankiales bacterium]|nr:MAG: PucR family transcriptional regulator [Frankiales bacterium]
MTSLAPITHAQAVPLPELVDGIALRTGAWVVVERFGTVLTHGAGRSSCPPAVTAALLGKRGAPLREAVRWSRGSASASGTLRGVLDDAPVVAVELGGGATAWFVGAAPEDGAAALLRAAIGDEGPVTDAFVEDLLHPRGPSRTGRAPAATLAVLLSSEPLQLLARSALAAVGGSHARVHTETDVVVVALAVDGDVADLVGAVRDRCPDAVAGAARVAPGATDWAAAARAGAAAARAARRLGLVVGDCDEPGVSAELVVDEAQEAAAALLQSLVAGPLDRLREHDARSGGSLVETLTAWCAVGCDVNAAARRLHVHANTLRYRLRRAAEVSGLDLERPRHVLALQLLLAV